MHKWSLKINAVVFLLMMTIGCHHNGSSQKQAENVSIEKSDYTDNAKAWADSMLSSMTIEERVGQLFMPSSYASIDHSTIKKLKSYVADYHVGGVVFLKGDISSQALLSDTLQSLSLIPLFIALDAEWGLNMRYSDAPRYPANGRLSNASESVMYEYGYEIARQSRRLGINMLLGPVLDVVRVKEGVIGRRSFGSNSDKVATLGVAYSKGVEAGSVLTVSKHFPGHGSVKEDSHLTLPIAYCDSLELDSIDFKPFKEYIDAGLSGIMVGHIALPSIEKEIQSATLSSKIMKQILRKDMKFDGLILTDAMNMGGVGKGENLSVKALKSGADIIISPKDTDKEIEAVMSAIDFGEISIEEINQKVRRILFFKYKVGLNEMTGIHRKDVAKDVWSATAQRLSEMLDSVAAID